MQLRSLSYHAASGNIALGSSDGNIRLVQTAPYIAPSFAPQAPPRADRQAAAQAVAQGAPQEDHLLFTGSTCVRERLAEAQAEAAQILASIEIADAGLRQQMSREQELKRSIADLEAKCTYLPWHDQSADTCLVAREKEALAEMQTAEYIAQSREFNKLVERHNALLGIINDCTQTLDSLTDCLSVSGLEDVRGRAFKEWLCDIGMSKLQTALKDMDGSTLTLHVVRDIMDYDVTFNDAAALQLRAYIAHNKLSDDSAFPPPRDSVLSWDESQTANWIASLGDWYSSLAAAGWHGAALCSLTAPLVTKASNGALKAADAVEFLGLVRAWRNETDGDKAEWVAKWTGTSSIEAQAV